MGRVSEGDRDMNIVLIAFSSFMLALSGALVPGPLFTITVSESFKRGSSAGPLIILGHGILELVFVLLITFQVAPFLSTERAGFVIGLGGGVILVFMGIMLLKDAGRARLDMTAGGKQTGMHPVVSGFIGSLSNPYWVIWWLTIGLGYLMSSMKSGVIGIFAFFSGHIAADLVWYSLISYAVSKGRRMIGDRGYRFMLYACGIFLVFFGGWFIAGV
jgi:threonine/homoserine/homoserine lactone efflux protein